MLMLMGIEDVEIKHLATLRTVAEEGSFIGAAAVLGYAQAASSQQVLLAKGTRVAITP